MGLCYSLGAKPLPGEAGEEEATTSPSQPSSDRKQLDELCGEWENLGQDIGHADLSVVLGRHLCPIS